MLVLFWLGLALLVGPASAGCGGRFNCLNGEAVCIRGSCVCQSPFSRGNGNFACYRDRDVGTEIKSDPHLISFNNDSSPFPFPCRYLVTHVKQKLKDRNGAKIGKCEFEIYAFNAKAPNKGKFFAHGFDVAGKLKYDNGKIIRFSSRNYGIAKNGVYIFKREGTWGRYFPNGPWGNDRITWVDNHGVKVKVKVDDENNRLVFEAKKCGVVITFVPYDVENPHGQTSLPGISVAINEKRNLKFLDHSKVMALAPFENGGQSYSDIVIGGLDEETSLLTRAFTNGYEQVQPYNDRNKCVQTGVALSGCRRNRGELRKAYRSCYWMLKEPRFIRCYDDTKGAGKILKLFKKCIRMWCGNVRCSKVQGLIMESGCHETVKDISSVDRFMKGDMCP